MECSSGKVRLQFKSAIESSRIEYKKILKEIDKLDTSLKQTNITQGYIASKIESNTNKLIDTKTISEEIVSRDKLTAQELERQGQQLMNIHSSLAVVDSNLTIVQQITAVMKRKDLFYKLKLYLIIIVLFLANLLILILKIR